METIEFRGKQAVYLVHGAIVWTFLSIATLPAILTGAVDCITHPTKALWVYLLTAMVIGQMLGAALFNAVRIAGLSGRVWLHFLIPLLVAALIGAGHSIFSTASFLVAGGTTLPLRPAGVRLIVSILTAIAATPIIIVRSARMSARMGFQPPLNGQRKDPRWST